MAKKTGLFWLKDDFRLKRNNALSEATKNHDNVVAFYLYKEKIFDFQEAQRWWVSKSLAILRKKLEKFNINLEVIKTDSYQAFFEKLLSKRDFAIYWNRVYEPKFIKFDKFLINNFKKKSIEFKIFKGNILNEFNEVKKNDGTPFKVFTPFWRNAEKFYFDKVPSPEKKLKKCKNKVSYFKNNFNEDKILPNKSDWYLKFEKIWEPSEEEALKQLKNFINGRINEYSEKRNFPNILGTSKLSPYIKHGQIHVNTIWNKCKEIKSKGVGYRKFINELGWREFSHSLINYFPEFLKGNFRKEFDRFPWAKNEKFLKAWKTGMTGYPIVDAGMRELYETGWMHNRIRMVVGSFLVKHLRINWTEGEKHFRNCLLDFNKANNVAQWQWVAGCGADAAPYFRIFNPILQGEKFDKEGLYVKKWVTELNKVPSKFIHKPWEMELKYQQTINTLIGKDYPKPIVIHEEARASALKAFQSLKKN